MALPSLRNLIESWWRGSGNQPLPSDPPACAALIRLDLFGDHVNFGGFIERLRQAWPKTRLVLVCMEKQKLLYRHCPCIDDFVTLDYTETSDRKKVRAEAYARLRALKPGWIINAMRERPMMGDRIMRYCHAPVRLGFTGSRVRSSDPGVRRHNRYYTHLIDSVPYEPWLPEIEVNRLLLEKMTGHVAPECPPRIWTSPEDRAFAERIYRESGFVPEQTLVYFTSSTREVRTFRLLKEWIAELLRRKPWTVMAVGSPDEYENNEPPSEDLRPRWLNLCRNSSLEQTAELMRMSRLVIGVETGLAQIAGAVKAPHVILISGAFFGRFLPTGASSSLIVNPLGCYFCEQKCLYDQPYCMTDILFEVFQRGVEDALAAPHPKARIYLPGFPDASPTKPPAKPAFAWDDHWINPASMEAIRVAASQRV